MFKVNNKDTRTTPMVNAGWVVDILAELFYKKFILAGVEQIGRKMFGAPTYYFDLSQLIGLNSISQLKSIDFT